MRKAIYDDHLTGLRQKHLTDQQIREAMQAFQSYVDNFRGSLVTFGLSLVFPPGIPLVFEPSSAATAIGSILVIGPLGGLVSVRLSLRVEPLIALGLGG